MWCSAALALNTSRVVHVCWHGLLLRQGKRVAGLSRAARFAVATATAGRGLAAEHARQRVRTRWLDWS